MGTLFPIIVLILSAIVTAQSGSLNTSSPDLNVLKQKLGPIIRVDVSHRDPPPNADDSPLHAINPPRDEWRFKAEIKVQNTGSKTIKSIEWEVLFILRENSTLMSRGYTAHSRKSIRAGETVTLASWIKDDSLKIVRTQRQKGLLKEKVQISRIEYADGSIWEAEKSMRVH